jgi:hypothetical protein
MWTPNAQNWLIELANNNFCPTGSILIRDLEDSIPSEFALRSLNKRDFLNSWTARKNNTFESKSGNSFFNANPKIHLMKLWLTFRLTPWQFSESFLEASLEEYFDQLERIILLSSNQTWKLERYKIHELHRKMKLILSEFMKERIASESARQNGSN